MSEPKTLSVGDWLRLESDSTGAQRFVKIERETNTQWVCSDNIHVHKQNMSVHGDRRVFAEAIPGVGANVALVIDSDRKVASANVIADLLDADGYAEQAAKVREAIASYRAYVEPRETKPLKPKWSKLKSYTHGAPREFRSRYELRIEDSILATIRAHNLNEDTRALHGGEWRWIAQIEYTKFSEIHLTVASAKAAIKKELGGKVND